MRTLLQLFLLLATTGAWAAPGLPYFVKQGPSIILPYPQTLADTMGYWVSSDLPLSNSVASWVSRISASDTLAQTVSGNRPTNSSLGVYFGGTSVLTNNSKSWWSSVAGNSGTFFFIVYKNSYTDAALEIMLQDYPGGVSTGFKLENSFIQYGSANWGHIAGANTYRDFVFVLDTATAKAYCWTNGVSVGAVINLSTTFQGLRLGNRLSGGSPWLGYITEFAVITNHQSDSVISNLHYYATNTYSFTP